MMEKFTNVHNMFGLNHRDEFQGDFDSSSDEGEETQSIQDDFEQEMKQEMESHTANLTQSTPG